MLSALTDRVRYSASWTVRAVRERGHERHIATQAAKASVAAMMAWLVAAEWLALPQAYLAPYVAVFLVETTVFRSVRQALVQMAIVLSGVLLAAAAITLVPGTTLSIGAAVLVGWFVGRWRVFGTNGIWVAITALFVIATGVAGDPVMLGDRLIETAIGAVCGLVVTAVLFPPLYPVGDEVEALTRETRSLLGDMAAGTGDDAGPGPGGWARRAEEIDRMMERAAESSQWARESARLNPRPIADRVRDQATASQDILGRMWYAVPALRELARVAESASDGVLAEADDASRCTVPALLTALAELVDRIGDAGDDPVRFDEARDRCAHRLAELQRSAAGSGDPHVAAVLGSFWHPAHRFLTAVQDTGRTPQSGQDHQFGG
ncbi:FUSC family protein [Rhodococcus indonesiensis]|uniref:FUSC family protein n=1 Tax=Rhodococcus indonesiensis TaxID=3055869 RepID=UPI0039F6C884